MTSTGSKKNTKYSFKGNVKKVENKYANIYQDLSEKEKIYKNNSLKKKFELPEGEEEKKNDPNEMVIRTVSYEEAEKAAKERKKAIKNELIIATKNAIPVNVYKETSDIDSIESLKRLKQEQKALVKSQEPEEVSDKTVEFEFTLDDENYINNDPEYIREKAKERATMDKSDVEIYKEYSDFEKVTTEKEDSKRTSSFEEKAKKLLSKVNDEKSDEVSKEAKEFMEGLKAGSIDKTELEEIKKPVISEDIRYNNEATQILEQLNTKDEIRAKEEEIEIIKRMKEQEEPEVINITNPNTKKSGFSKPKKEKTKKEKVKKTEDKKIAPKKTKDIRADVYKKNSKKNNKTKVKVKKIGAICIILAIVGIFGAALMDKLFIVKDTPSIETTKPIEKPKPEEEKPKTEEKLTDKEKIRKLEAIKANLSADEAIRVDYITEHIREYPENLINLVLKNPETVDYVYSYKDREKYNEKTLSKNISSSYYVNGDLPLFLQWDRRWGYRKYGKEMIGLTGCGPTSLSMVIRHFDKNSGVNPYDIAQFSEENGYLSKDNFTSWKLFEKGVNHFGLQSRDVIPVEAKMKKALDDGNMLIASVKPGTFTDVGHIIVIKGYDKAGNFLINDPNSIVNTNKSWSYDQLKTELKKLWAISPEGSYSSNYDEEKPQQTEKPQTTEKIEDNEGTDSNYEQQDNSGSSEDPSIIQDID